MMKRIIPAIITGAALLLLFSCNEKPRHYSFIQNMSDGQQIVENIDAKNDTDALNMYIDRMSKVIVENMNKTDSTAGPQIVSMYVVSPDGDTLNTNKELMHVVEEQIMMKQTAVPAR